METVTDLRLLLFRLERAGDPTKTKVTVDEMRSCCREAKYALRELLAQREKEQ